MGGNGSIGSPAGRLPIMAGLKNFGLRKGMLGGGGSGLFSTFVWFNVGKLKAPNVVEAGPDGTDWDCGVGKGPE